MRTQKTSGKRKSNATCKVLRLVLVPSLIGSGLVRALVLLVLALVRKLVRHLELLRILHPGRDVLDEGDGGCRVRVGNRRVRTGVTVIQLLPLVQFGLRVFGAVVWLMSVLVSLDSRNYRGLVRS